MDRNAIRIVPDGSGREENNDYTGNSNYDCNYDDSSSSGLSSSSSSSSRRRSSSSSSSGLSSLSSNNSDHKTMVQTNGVSSHCSSNNNNINNNNISNNNISNSNNKKNNNMINNTLAGNKRGRSRVPLFRCVVWMALVSVIGFFLGRDFAKKDPQAKLWLDSVVLLKGSQLTASLARPANQTEAASSEPSVSESQQSQSKVQSQSQSKFQSQSQSQSQSPLLRQYLAEFQQRTVVLPRFDTKTKTESARASARARAASRRKEFAELVVHPVLLVSGTGDRQEDPSKTVAIALDLERQGQGQGHDISLKWMERIRCPWRNIS